MPACSRPAIVESDAGVHGGFGERAVVIVVKEQTGRGVAGNVNVGPAVVVEIAGKRGEAVVGVGLRHSGCFADVGESAIAVVVIELAVRPLQAARTAHHRHPFPQASRAAARLGRVLRIEINVVRNEEVEAAVAVVIEKSAARGPARVLVPQASLARHVSEGTVAVVVQQNVVAPEGNEQVHEPIVVVIASADSLPPADEADSGFLRDVRERPIVLVAVKMAGRLLTLGEAFQSAAVDRKISGQPSLSKSKKATPLPVVSMM